MQMKRKPSESGQAERVTDDLRLLVGQSVEETRERSLPHVKRPVARWRNELCLEFSVLE